MVAEEAPYLSDGQQVGAQESRWSFSPKAGRLKAQEELMSQAESNVLWLGMVASACNPNYSGGRDQGDCGLRPSWAKCYQDPISTN
jgi:hypothetical protein